MKILEGIAALILACLVVGALALATPEAPVAGVISWLTLVCVIAGVLWVWGKFAEWLVSLWKGR